MNAASQYQVSPNPLNAHSAGRGSAGPCPAGPYPADDGDGSILTAERARGLPTSGAVAVALVAGIGGAAVDILTGTGLRAVFAVTFVTGCVLAATLVRRRGLAAAVVLPPLVYAAVALGTGLLQRDTGTGSWLLQELFELMNALVIGAPVLLVATAAAGAVATLRCVAGRYPIRRPHLPTSG